MISIPNVCGKRFESPQNAIAIILPAVCEYSECKDLILGGI